MSEYTLTQAELKKLKSALTRAINSGNPDKVIAEADKAMAIFEAKGYPDCWSNWERAKSDAEFQNQRNGKW